MKLRFITHLDANSISTRLRRISPTLADLGEALPVADGFSSHVFLIDTDVILRVAKHNEATTHQVKEYKVLPHLQQHISVQIPQPKWYLQPSEYFPFGALAYPKIVGIPFSLALANQVDLEQVSFSLATFLLELQSIEPQIPLHKRDNEPALLWNNVRSILQAHLNGTSFTLAEAWWHSFEKRTSSLNSNYVRPVHGDLWGENIILDDSLSHIVGVIDFEMLALGDIAQDFSPQSYISSDFLGMVVRKFQALGGYLGENFDQRVYDWAILRELRGLAHAITYPEANELEDSLQKVTRFWSDMP